MYVLFPCTNNYDFCLRRITNFKYSIFEGHPRWRFRITEKYEMRHINSKNTSSARSSFDIPMLFWIKMGIPFLCLGLLSCMKRQRKRKSWYVCQVLSDQVGCSGLECTTRGGSRGRNKTLRPNSFQSTTVGDKKYKRYSLCQKWRLNNSFSGIFYFTSLELHWSRKIYVFIRKIKSNDIALHYGEHLPFNHLMCDVLVCPLAIDCTFVSVFSNAFSRIKLIGFLYDGLFISAKIYNQ